MENVYYKEEELYNGNEGVFAEDYIFNWCGDYHIGLCINAHTLFCRADNCSDGHQHLSQTNRASSWLKMLDDICPEIAWGVTAWLFFYSNRDNKGRLRFLKTTKAEVFARYKEECIARYRYLQRDEYDYFKENGDTDGIKNLDEAFNAEHIKTERENIGKFAHHECMSEEYYQAILQCAKEYIEWVEEKKKGQEEKATAPISTEDVYYENKTLHYDRLLGYLKEWNDSDHNKRHIQIVNAGITTKDFRHSIRTADMNIITAIGYRDYLILQLVPYFSEEWLREVERNVGKTKRKMGSNYNKLPSEFRNNFKIMTYEIK